MAAMAGTVACALPVFLLGAVAVQIRESVHFGAGTLGLLVALYYLGAAASSVALGRLVESVGALRIMRVAPALSAVVLGLIAAVARSSLTLAALLVVAGIASAAMQPASNSYLSRRMSSRRQGEAFGIKQSAVPLTTLLAGLAVPALALTVGWRFAFGLAAVLAAVVAVVMPRPSIPLAQRRAESVASAPPSSAKVLWVLAGGFGLGLTAAGSLTAFLASSAVSAGAGRGWAGLLVGIGGAAAVVGRIVAGRRADRRGGDHLPAVAWMLAVGALGYGGLAVATVDHAAFAYLPIVLVVFGAGWGWNGLFNFAVIRDYPDRPAWATGVTQTGGRVGGMVGPFLFGELVSHSSYAVAWGAAGAISVAAAAVVLAGGRMAARGTGGGARSAAGTPTGPAA